MFDRFTRWSEAVPVADITADTVINAFYAWIARFGALSQITTDRSSNFESLVFQALVRLGAERSRTTPYHPASNGAIERFHRFLKTAIRCHASAKWVDVLPSVLLGLRASLKEDLGAAELVYGSPILSGEFFTEKDPSPDPQIFLERLRQHIRKVRPSSSAHHISPRAFAYKELHSCTHVFVRVDASKRPFDRPVIRRPVRSHGKGVRSSVQSQSQRQPSHNLYRKAQAGIFGGSCHRSPRTNSRPLTILRTYPAARLTKKVRFAV